MARFFHPLPPPRMEPRESEGIRKCESTITNDFIVVYITVKSRKNTNKPRIQIADRLQRRLARDASRPIEQYNCSRPRAENTADPRTSLVLARSWEIIVSSVTGDFY